MNGSKYKLQDVIRIAPWLLGTGAFLVYLLTMVRDIAPGASVRILNTVSGLYYLPVLPHYLYSSLAKVVTKTIPGDTLFKLNALSALFGALSIVLVFKLLLRMPMFVIRDKASPIQRSASQESKFIAMVASSLFLIFCAPLWLSSTRPDNHTFDLFLLLSSFWMILQSIRPNARPQWILASAFVYGLGITEYATMIALSPLFVISLVLALFYRRELNTTRIWQLTALGFCGLLFYLAPVWAVGRLPDWGYQEYTGFGSVLLDLWRKQYLELKSCFPRVGSLLISLCAFAPWIYVFLVPRPNLGSIWLAHALTIVALLILNALGIAQLMEKGMTPTLVTGLGDPSLIPYLAIASWMGYLAGYWWFRSHLPNSIDSHGWIRPLWRLVAVVNLLLPFAIAIANYIHFMPSKAPELIGLARNMVRSCQDRPFFIISKSILDDLIRYAAFQQGQPKQVILSQDFSHPSYRRYLAGMFPQCGINTSVYAAQTDVLKTIVSNNPKGPAGCSLFNPDIALSIGFQFIPNGLVVIPVENLKKQNAEEIYRRNIDLYENMFANQINALRAESDTNALKFFVRQNYSRCANNVGVSMQLLGSDDLAEKSYDLALNIFPQNPSALLNQRAIYLKKTSSFPTNAPEAKALLSKAAALLDRAQREASRFPRFFRTPFLMAANYGYLYSEQFSLTLAEFSRRGGNRDFESGAVEQARLINPESISVQISSALLSMGKGDLSEAESEYHRILKSQPNNQSAWIGLAVLARDRQDYEGAIRVLEENPAMTNSVNAQSLLGLLYIEGQDSARGETIYNQMLKATNHTTLSASFVALSAWQLSQLERAETFAQKVLAGDPRNAPMLRLRAAIAQKRGDLAAALSCLQRAQEADQGDIPLRETILRLSIQLKQNVSAREDAETLIAMDPNNMVGNMAMATLTEIPEIRETYLRRCLQNKSHPLYGVAVNNLAYDLIQMNRYAEAVPLAEEAVNLQPSNDKYHHTLAEAYKGLGQYDKALEQISLASTIAPDDANHALIHGEILIAKGESKPGYSLIVKALPNLSGEWRDRALKLLKR
jgi:tetratricopeptide (TPR) repeat protein